MRRKILLFIFIIMLTLTGIVNVSAKDEYDGELTIEYLLRNYNVVTLGTRDKYQYSAVNDKTGVKGSVTNVYDIGGPVLIRGNYTGTETLENEFAQKTNGIPSYISGYLGQNVRSGSKESADISNIYVGNNNTVYKSENVYVVNKTKYNYEYPVYRTDDYIGFDSLYAAVVTQQGSINWGEQLILNDPTLLMEYKDYLDTNKSKYIINEPGNYNYSNSVDKIYIFDYDPNELYVITNTIYNINKMPELEIRYSDGTLYKTNGNSIYCGRTDSNEDCTGNIVWNLLAARYVKLDYTTIGHIIAPKADVELLESHYAGTIIANSLASEANKKTAIQFYPYNLDKKITNSKGSTCVTESEDTDTDVYYGNYSIDELLRNYSVVSLGQKEYSPNTKLLEHNVPKGSVNIFHMAGGFLINGNLGLEGVDYTSKNKYGYSGMKLEFRYSDSSYANSFLKGNLGNDAHFITSYEYKNICAGPSHQYNVRFYMNNDTGYAVDKDNARGALNVILDRERLVYGPVKVSDNPLKYEYKYHYEYSNRTDYNTYIKDNVTGNYLGLGYNVYAQNNNYINFSKLYNSVVEQQKNINKGSKLNKSSNGELIIPIGGNYYIDDLDDISRIRFSNWSNNKNVLTVVTITDPDVINFPAVTNESGSYVYTSDYYGRGNSYSSSQYYPNEYVTADLYHGNIVWNIPNANYIKLAGGAPFFGHIIAPNADVETPELHFAGAMVVNSLYTDGYTEAHFFPLKTGSIGTGVGYKTKTIGICQIEKSDISGTIKWNDSDNASNTRPSSVTVKLLEDGEELDKITVTEADGWKYTFKDKPKTSQTGKKLNYTIKIDKIENYNTLVSGYNVTNTYQPKVEALTLEYLLRNYNIVSLGTKEYFAHSQFNNKDTIRGSVTNIYDIGGPVLIRGNFKSSTNLENEFAQKTNGVPSFILGKLGDNITPGSKEYVDISDIHVGTNNTVYKSENVYQVNNTTFKYEYPVYRNNEYLGFDSLYATIVTEQSTFDDGKQLLINDPTLLMKYNDYLDTTKNNIIISEPGNYNYSNSYIDKIYIFDYDPNEVYIINNTNKYIYEMPEVEIRYSDGRLYDTKSDAVYCGRKNEYESCTGNIIWSFKNARYVQADYSTIGHIIAPNADVELLESHYAGTIIANSITSLSNSKTAVQFYPYNLDKKLVTEKGANCITEDVDLDDDVYSGNYSLDELLKNYSVVSLGQKENEKNTKLYQYNSPQGTTNIFHIAGGFLINGDLGIKEVEYKERTVYSESSYSSVSGTNYTYPGIRLDFRYTNNNYSNSYLKGNLGSHAYLSDNYGDQYRYMYDSSYLGSSRFYVSTNFKYANKSKAQSVFKLYSWINRKDLYNDMDPNKYITDGNKYILMSKDIHAKSNNFINFERLYNSVVEQQSEINVGTTLTKSGNQIVIPTGGNYTIDSLEGVSQIKFNNFSNNKNVLTVITIKDTGAINFPKIVNESGGLIKTNDWNGRWNSKRVCSTSSSGSVSYCRYYSSESLIPDTYYGNIVWNLPNATYIKLAPNAPFVGHVIAPNADVEMPETHFAGAMIVNSLNAEGHSEAHFYPLTVGSVGTGIETKKKVIGVCEIEKTDVSGIISWVNDDNSTDRPKQMTINLLQDGKKIKEIVVTEADGWKYEVKDLPKTTVSGEKINYTITTNDVLAEYSTSISGYNIINTYKINDYLNYSIEYLLRNYNVVTLGTKETHGNINTNLANGSVANVFDIGGPVLIRGDYTSTPTYDNEFAQKTNGVPSYIKGTLGKGITPGSKEYAEISDIYVGNSNAVHNNGSVYVVNENSFDYGYPVYTDDNYIDFDKLYASIMNEQTSLTIDANYISSNTPYISEPGKYSISSSATRVSISNYDPNELYIIRMSSTEINSFPKIEIRYSDFDKYETDGDVVYCGRKDSDEDCGGNIIWVFPNARYIKTDYSTIGHIIAPKADIELVESHYPGSIIANSITATANTKTAIQFYPYNLNKELTSVSGSTCITEAEYYSNNTDIYTGSYTISELLYNYSIVTLGQKELGSDTKLAQYGAPTGTANIFHIVGGFLIEGDLGINDANYIHNNKDALTGVKLEFRYLYSGNSYLKGHLRTNAHTVMDGRKLSSYYTDYEYLKSTRLYVNNDVKKIDDIIEAQIALNARIVPLFTDTDDRGNIIIDRSNYAQDQKTGKYFKYEDNILTNANNYIDFKALYDVIVDQQKDISKGQVVTPDNDGVVTIPIGGNYTIENIANAKKIRFTNYANNQNVATVITINDNGRINLPFQETDTWNNTYTNNYYNRWNKRKYNGNKLIKFYDDEIVVEENYYGNIIFNIPNANYIKFSSNNSFKGHVIAPNADVEMPEMNFAGAMIVNSLYAEGNSEAHFYPLTVSPFTSGFYPSIIRTIGTCEQKEYVTLNGKKVWDDNDNQDGVRPNKITLNVLADGKKVKEQEYHAYIASENIWNYTISGLPKKNPLGKDINYSITEKAVDNYSTSIDGYDITNSYTPKKTSLTVNKIWDDEDNRDGKRPDTIMVQLYANGNPKGTPVELNIDNNWMHIFSEIDMNSNGQKIDYTIKEVIIPDGYTSKVTGNQTDGYTITNTHPSEKKSLTINKVWDDEDNRDGKRPSSINVQLYKDGEVFGDVVTLNSTNNWTYKYEDLYVYNQGKEVEYTIKEVNDIGVYTPTITETEEGYTITNGYEPERVSLSVNKVWDDEDNIDGIRPESIDIQLYADGKELGDVITLNDSNNWTHNYEQLYVYNNGQKINYTIKEIEVDGYSSEIIVNGTNGYTITNSHKPTKTSLKINKVWDDKNDKDGIRPEKVLIQLYKDGEPLGEPVEVNKENDWSYEFEDLYVYENGEKVKYTVEMYQEIDGYTYEITGNEEEGYTITNTHIPNENKNPNTLDNIIKFIIISIISLIMLVIGIIIFKKLRRKEV